MKIIGVVLGGGTGSRLKPLTVRRAKPAVPLAGQYRLVDVPISNCINSNIYQIYLLTQYQSASLHHHIQSTYRFDQFSRGFVQLLAAEQKSESREWFQGTADAVRQSMHYLASSGPELVVILSGDQLFRLDFQKVIARHLECRADVTVCTTPVPRSEAAELGIMQRDRDGRIRRFLEKPGLRGLTPDFLAPVAAERYAASMGIYIFNFEVLRELVEKSAGADFGHHIIPEAIESHRVYGYLFDGYWKDIGTIGSFWRANLELAGSRPPFSLYDQDRPMYTRPRFLPPSRIHGCIMTNCLLSEGASITSSNLNRSVIGLRSVIRSGGRISESVIMGHDFFEKEDGQTSLIPLGIGRNCRIERAIIDKNVRIGDDVVISPRGMGEAVTDLYTIRDGVIVIPKGTIIPPGTVIGRYPVVMAAA